MPIEMNDPYGNGQSDIPLGKSSLPVRETYSAEPRAIRLQYEDAVQKANQVFSAVKELSSTFKEQAAQQQATTDKVATLQQDAMTAGTDLTNQGGGGGVLSRAFPGAGSPDGTAFNAASPAVQATIAHNAGANDASTFFNTDPDFQALLANRDLMNNPQALEQAATDLWNKKSASLATPGQFGGHNDALYRGGMASGFQHFLRATLGQSAANSIEYQRGVAKESAERWLTDNQNLSPTQQAAYRAAVDAGVDPTKLTQFVAIENPQWNNHSVSSNGSAGITQISDGRWEDIKQQLIKDGHADIASTLTDRSNPYQNARAWAAELPRMEAQAKSVLGRDPTAAETYLYWLQPATASKALANPDAPVSSIYSADTIRANPAVFRGVNTVSQMLDKVGRTMNSGSSMHVQYQPSDRMPRELITQDTWQDNFTKNGYKWSDFKNSGQYGGDGQIDRRAVDAIDQLSSFMGRKIPITSAYRSDDYNRAVAGATHNHQTGDSLDVTITDPAEQKKAVAFLASIGARGIGTYGTHVHFDFATGRPNQQKDVNTWSKGGLPLDEVNAAVKDGLSNRQQGNYYPMTGFQGRQIDPTEAKIQYLRTQYGIPPAEGRKMVLTSAKNAALNKAYSGDAAGAHQDLAFLRENFGALSDSEQLDLNKTHADITNIQTALRNRDDQQEAFDARQALNNYIKLAENQAANNPNGGPLQPKQSDFPQTAAGFKAYRDARELGLNINGVDEATSNGNYIQTLADITGDPSKFAKGLGFEDWTKVQPSELKAAIYKQRAGMYNPADANKIVEAYEKQRQALPVSKGEAMQAAKIHEAEIQQAFTMNTDALRAIQEANSNPAAQGMLAPDPYRAKDEIKNYVELTNQFFQKNYAERYKAAMVDNNGQPLAGDQKDALAQAALQSTQAYARSLSNAIVANKADMAKVNEAEFGMQHPQEQFEREVFAAQKTQLGKEGYVATDVKFPGVPTGTFVMLGKDGKPQKTADGSYKMLTPTNQVFYFKPQFNVVPQGAPQPTQAPADLQPPAQPQQQPQQPAQPDVPPVVQRMADTIDQFHNWLKNQKGVDGSGKAFMQWLMQQSAAAATQDGPPTTP